MSACTDAVQRFAPEFAAAARARQHIVGDRWHVDETYLKIGGTWRYLFRAIDQFGQVIDVFLSPRRNGQAARRFFERALGRTRVSPVEGTTDPPAELVNSVLYWAGQSRRGDHPSHFVV